ncbi:TasA family protein [Bacillus sp. FJAT-45066]|uniref:TasA family protein n=1 Tax=Bacillus sp. FJAT-45066 TaxID=2011010 RepID=UPI000BB8A8A7|nr:TasA family protein [Bacillus sp. FJAT-45066]
MKNMKKVLGTTALAGAILIGGGFGTYSYFSDQMETSGSVQAGSLFFERDGFTDKNVFEAVNIAPEKVVVGELLEIKNSGSLPMWMRFAMDLELKAVTSIEDALDKYPTEFVEENFYKKDENGNDVMITAEDLYEHYKIQLLVFHEDNITSVENYLAENITIGSTNEDKFNALTNTTFLNMQYGGWKHSDRIAQTGGFTSLETLHAPGRGAKWSYLNDFQPSQPRNRTLEPGESFYVMFNLMLDKQAGNEYQESEITVDLYVQGIQKYEGANGRDGSFVGTFEDGSDKFVWDFSGN